MINWYFLSVFFQFIIILLVVLIIGYHLDIVLTWAKRFSDSEDNRVVPRTLDGYSVVLEPQGTFDIGALSQDSKTIVADFNAYQARDFDAVLYREDQRLGAAHIIVNPADVDTDTSTLDVPELKLSEEAIIKAKLQDAYGNKISVRLMVDGRELTLDEQDDGTLAAHFTPEAAKSYSFVLYSAVGSKAVLTVAAEVAAPEPVVTGEEKPSEGENPELDETEDPVETDKTEEIDEGEASQDSADRESVDEEAAAGLLETADIASFALLAEVAAAGLASVAVAKRIRQ